MAITISTTDGIPGKILKTNHGKLYKQKVVVCGMSELGENLDSIHSDLESQMVAAAEDDLAEAIVGYSIHIFTLNNSNFVIAHSGTMCEIAGDVT